MNPRQLAVALMLTVSAASIGACAQGGVGLGSMRLPGLGAPPTAEEQSKLGALGTRYASLRERVDTLLTANAKSKRIEDNVVAQFKKLLDDASQKLEALTRDPADNGIRLQTITVLSDIERLLIAQGG